MGNLYKNQKGLSLVELMISITLGLILMAGVIQVFLSSRTVFSTQQAMSRAQENGRLGMELMAEDIRMAGFWGCANRDAKMENDLPSGFWNNYVIANTSNAVQGMAASGISGLAPAPLTGSPGLVLRYASGTPLLLTEQNQLNNVTVSGVVANNCVGEVCANKPAVISNCVAARVFMPTAIAGAGSGAATISHGGAWDPHSLISLHEVFYPGAEVMPVNTVVFYLANNAANRPSLYRYESQAGNAMEVIEGVERLHFQFGINDEYHEAAAITNWTAVSGVRIDMLVQGGEQRVLADDTTYMFAGAEVTPADPKRLYQVFSSTVAIRSRAE